MGTQTVSASQLRGNLSESLDAVTQENMLILTRRGKDDLAIIDVDVLEDLLMASDPTYLKQIAEARDRKEYYTHEEVFGNLS